MKTGYKILLSVIASVAVTFLSTVYFIHKNSTRTAVNTVIHASIEMESLNDIGRVKNYDFLESLLRKGCSKEAIEFVEYQKISLLYGLQLRMNESETVRNKVIEINSSVGERAIKEASHQSSYTYPTCK